MSFRYTKIPERLFKLFMHALKPVALYWFIFFSSLLFLFPPIIFFFEVILGHKEAGMYLKE